MDTQGTPWIVFLVIAAGVVLALAGWLARAGFRPRRVGRTPHCPRCDYELTGLVDDAAAAADQSSTRCPECGTAVSARSAARGDRPPRRARGWVGAALLAVGLGVAGVGGSGALRTVDWNRWKPAGWLIRDLRSADMGVCEAAWGEVRRRLGEGSFAESSRADLDAAVAEALVPLTTPGATIEDSADEYVRSRFGVMTPATRRTLLTGWAGQTTRATTCVPASRAIVHLRTLLDTGVLTAEDHACLTDAALARQAAASVPGARPGLFDDFLYDYLGDRAARRQMREPQRTRFFEQALATTFAVRPVAVEGEPVPYAIGCGGAGPLLDWTVEDSFEPFVCDGEVVAAGGHSSGPGLDGGSHGATFAGIRAGAHVIRMALTRTVTCELDAPGPDGKRPARYTRRYELTAPVAVLPAGSPLPVRWVSNPAVGEQLRRALVPCEVRLALDGSMNLSIAQNELPVGVSFRVFVRTGGKEYPVRTLAAAKGTSVNQYLIAQGGPRWAGQGTRCDVIFRSDPAAAMATVDVLEAWRGELVYPDVPVK